MYHDVLCRQVAGSQSISLWCFWVRRTAQTYSFQHSCEARWQLRVSAKRGGVWSVRVGDDRAWELVIEVVVLWVIVLGVAVLGVIVLGLCVLEVASLGLALVGVAVFGVAVLAQASATRPFKYLLGQAQSLDLGQETFEDQVVWGPLLLSCAHSPPSVPAKPRDVMQWLPPKPLP